MNQWPQRIEKSALRLGALVANGETDEIGDQVTETGATAMSRLRDSCDERQPALSASNGERVG